MIMSSSILYPLTFEPIYKERVWGGHRLTSLRDPSRPQGFSPEPIGESWELVDLPTDQSIIKAGPLQGTSLKEIVQQWEGALMGPVPLDHGSFPALIKFIDAAEKLSVQVHPDGNAAAQLGGRPKQEAWYILDALPGAIIYLGLKPGTTRQIYEKSLATGHVEDLLVARPVHPGDLIPVLPGTVHAIGAGILLAEVQQPSDTTYRVYDWGRMGLDGQPRQLHLQEALASIHFHDAESQVLDAPSSLTRAELGLFKLTVKTLKPGEEIIIDNEGPTIWLGLEGSVSIKSEVYPSIACSRGSVILVPHACKPTRIETPPEPAKILEVSFSPAG